ncbi:uncharacterized protein [Nicotiana sylvestris]|uniref:uncharacterized protein n=1 Tax=Nicotiana sylvestris TaxID=4096 RepID=UPI00388C7995
MHRDVHPRHALGIALHLARYENKRVDASAALASSLTLPDQAQVTVCQKWVVPPPNEAEGEENELKHLVIVSEVEKEEWRQPIIDYLCYGILPENPRRRTEIRRRTLRFLYYKDTLYKRSFEGVLLRCLREDEALHALQEAHSGQHNASMYNVAVNGLAEAFNKTLCNLIKKVVSKSKRDWNDRIIDEENARLRLAELESLDEKRLEAQ